ncbi:MAG: type II toxin-antitoxin system RelE/ParE family toxin [Sphingorhabdus sp.]|uniref:type II toxin-antitoxin system RelE/ParE family toxin n=1 Tax=Sphingorhabdus sp. TaxID=1902408 RepID=UPI0025DB56C4|nr:type II toxin-antitoxin system RelE/ParE family toxin [Sphingorhabdus sp.]MCO4092970.1 type II toxin-antitoxin system RelE/ParE family toxin [Sphingorhabdus sp.]
MIDVRQTKIFMEWRAGLRDAVARKRIGARIDRLSFGNFGDAKSVGEGVSELRLDFGPGYRIYFVQRGDVLVILLCGGDKSTQARDIAKAKRLAQELAKEPNGE